MTKEYRQAADACKNALCQIGVQGKISIDRLLGCIEALQEDELNSAKFQKILTTLETIRISGPKNLELMLNIMTVLEQLRDGTFDITQIEQEDPEVIKEEEGSDEVDG